MPGDAMTAAALEVDRAAQCPRCGTAAEVQVLGGVASSKLAEIQSRVPTEFIKGADFYIWK
eukprot:3884157-Amphidinium_carterae.1